MTLYYPKLIKEEILVEGKLLLQLPMLLNSKMVFHRLKKLSTQIINLTKEQLVLTTPISNLKINL